MNRGGPNVGQASRLPSERASASGSVPSALPTEAGETPALHCGSWNGPAQMAPKPGRSPRLLCRSSRGDMKRVCSSHLLWAGETPVPLSCSRDGRDLTSSWRVRLAKLGSESAKYLCPSRGRGWRVLVLKKRVYIKTRLFF